LEKWEKGLELMLNIEVVYRSGKHAVKPKRIKLHVIVGVLINHLKTISVTIANGLKWLLLDVALLIAQLDTVLISSHLALEIY
jgi:hypothetical protein